jgi:hypothetical protein
MQVALRFLVENKIDLNASWKTRSDFDIGKEFKHCEIVSIMSQGVSSLKIRMGKKQIKVEKHGKYVL